MLRGTFSNTIQVLLMLLLWRSSGSFPVPSSDGARLPCRQRSKPPSTFALHVMPAWVSDSLIESAKQKVLWEQLEQQEKRPVLNLSRNREYGVAAPVQELDTDEAQDKDVSYDWMDGTCWNETRFGLEEIRSLPLKEEDATKLIQSVPQLLRLPSATVLDTARLLVQEYKFSFDVIQKEHPQLLLYQSQHVRYGIQFLSIMMSRSSNEKNDVMTIEACQRAPALLLCGIEGGLQELAVKGALGRAADATSKANQQIASNAMKSLDFLKSKRKR